MNCTADDAGSRGAGPAWPWLCLALGATGLVWHPLLDSYFYKDDFVHLFDLASRPFSRFILEPFNEHLYVVRNLGLAGMHALFGFEPRG